MPDEARFSADQSDEGFLVSFEDESPECCEEWLQIWIQWIWVKRMGSIGTPKLDTNGQKLSEFARISGTKVQHIAFGNTAGPSRWAK